RYDPPALVVHNEEGLALYDRAAQGSPELVLAELGLRPPCPVVEPVVGVQSVVAQELEGAPVELVAARLDLEVDHSAHGASELGREGAGLQLELVEGVQAREDHHRLQPG